MPSGPTCSGDNVLSRCHAVTHHTVTRHTDIKHASPSEVSTLQLESKHAESSNETHSSVPAPAPCLSSPHRVYLQYLPCVQLWAGAGRGSNLRTFREAVAINMEPLQLGAGRGDGRRLFIIPSYGLTRRSVRFLPQILSFL